MDFVVCNITAFGGSLVESMMDSQVLKEIGFGSKTSKKNVMYTYSFILIPIVPNPDFQEIDYLNSVTFIDNAIFGGGAHIVPSEQIKYSIYNIFKRANINLSTLNVRMTLDIIEKISYDSIDILYTDGSSKKATNQASYACCKITGEVIPAEESEDIRLDDFTGRYYRFEKFSGVIENGTNNIGELTGLKVASENFGDKKYQLIISDSEYSIKCMREWYYTWQANGWKTYAKKEVKNADLIKEIYNSVMGKNKIVLFKWTKAHVNNSFNELCDELAKNELGIEK